MRIPSFNTLALSLLIASPSVENWHRLRRLFPESVVIGKPLRARTGAATARFSWPAADSFSERAAHARCMPAQGCSPDANLRGATRRIIYVGPVEFRLPSLGVAISSWILSTDPLNFEIWTWGLCRGGWASFCWGPEKVGNKITRIHATRERILKAGPTGPHAWSKTSVQQRGSGEA